jgi:sulfate permease, SulP family
LGVAVLMIASQLGHLTGLPVPHGSVLSELAYVFTHAAEINLATVLMGAGMLVVLFLGSRVLPRLPWTLIAMLLAAGIASFAHLDRYGLQLVGPIPAGWVGLAVATAVAVVAVGVLWGIAAAIALSLADLLRRIARPHDALLGYLPGQAGMHNVISSMGGRCLAW